MKDEASNDAWKPEILSVTSAASPQEKPPDTTSDGEARQQDDVTSDGSRAKASTSMTIRKEVEIEEMDENSLSDLMGDLRDQPLFQTVPPHDNDGKK